jgi:hypothetical protein
LTCTGAPPYTHTQEEEEEEEEKEDRMEEEEEGDKKLPPPSAADAKGKGVCVSVNVGACGASYHQCCLPPLAATAGKDEEKGTWCCPACMKKNAQPKEEEVAAGGGKADTHTHTHTHTQEEGEEAAVEDINDLDTTHVDNSLPLLGWRMQRGRFLEPNWQETILTNEEHKLMARRALDTETQPTTIARRQSLERVQAQAHTHTHTQPQPPAPDAYMANLIGAPKQSMEEYEVCLSVCVCMCMCVYMISHEDKCMTHKTQISHQIHTHTHTHIK